VGARRDRRRMFEKVLGSAEVRATAQRLASGGRARLGGVWGSAAAVLASAIGRRTRRPILFIAPGSDAADDVADDIEALTGTPARIFPAWEADASVDHLNDEVTGERLAVCGLLASPSSEREQSVDVVVTSVMALLQPVPSPDALAAGRLTLRKGDEMDPQDLMQWLVDAGFERVDQVDRQAEFAHRGGIVDVFPPAGSNAVRLEFFGDSVDSIRQFDLDTQRSTTDLPQFDLVSLTAGEASDPAGRGCFSEYLSDDTIVCMAEPSEVKQLARDIHHRATTPDDDLPPPPGRVTAPDELLIALELFEPAGLWEKLHAFSALEMFTFMPRGAADVDNLGIRSLQQLATNPQEALRELEKLSTAAEVWVYCENPAEQKRFREVLSDSHPQLAQRVQTSIGHVASGFHWPKTQIVVVGHHEVFHRYAMRRRIRRVRAGRPIESLLDLDVGDYVVHVAHGIARFEGLRAMEQNGRTEEYLTLRFSGSAVLHVPAGQIDLVQKYIGTRKARPTLSRLGTGTWERQKQRVGEAVRDMAAEMLRFQAMRQSLDGQSYPAQTAWQQQFRDEFLYTETEDQLASMEQIDADMLASRPMDRLLCGDVGYGKTELAMRAAFKIVEAGRQVAVLVPTTVLAEQHYRTFRERLADYPMRVEMLSRFRKPAQQAQIVKDLTLGQIDVLIGTHRLLSKDVRFPDLGLVVVDEEQRFGVEHKEHLKHMRASVDVLTMTATPIPRTLHMALLGLRDISSLETPPLDRRAIHTEVRPFDEGLIRHAVLRELNREGQVFFVHNRVMDIEPLAERLRKLIPEARVDIGHGQMPEGQLERIMLRFVRREIDVLVCTTIIESGLDIPSANTMIIHDADRFGLAQLHQLRGRVGRYKHRAFCYLLLPQRRTVTPVATKRLKAIEDFSDLGAGFQIAMRDLELRGAGNILGKAQSGHIATVGYELYCQLLESAVHGLRGEAAPVRRDAHIELGIDAYIPRSYVASERQRMEVYRRLARCASHEDLQLLRADLADAFGAVPTAVETMLDLTEARIRAGALGIDSIIRMDPDIIFSVRDFQACERVFEGAAGSVRLPDDHTAYWRPPPAYREMPTLVRVLLKRLRDAGAPVQSTTRSGEKPKN
jgi:transcription-repair coupling factor (superfamily II helicase)